MVTNRDIEIAFVQAQNRINEIIENAQADFMLPDMERFVKAYQHQTRATGANINNPIANEEI